jgi:signal transduction histidine kinase
VLLGVAAGIGERHGIDPTLVRLAFIALSLAAGIGVAGYVVAAVISDDAIEPTRVRPSSGRQAFAFGLVVLGALILLREAGLWFGDRLVWPTVLAAAGSAVIWTRGDESERAGLAKLIARLPGRSPEVVSGAAPRMRLALGGLLMFAGLVGFALSNSQNDAPLAAVATLIGVGTIAGPWAWRIGHQLAEERRQRIRSQERAEVAAHLHDSVLQTLTMIQRSRQTREMASLARVQERELRAWLYGGSKGNDSALLSTALNDAAADIEQTHRVAIDVVAVGDCHLDEAGRAIVGATREAMLNAASHAGVDAVSVYAEADDMEITAFVRDLGRGFDPDRVPRDRRGIADSIEGRMARFGGSSQITTEPGRGTEVRLRIPRRPRDQSLPG